MVDRGRPLAQVALELLERQSIGVVLQDASGHVVDHNRAAGEVLQMSSEQLVGKSSLDESWEAVTAIGQPLDGTDHPAMRVLATGTAVTGFVMGVRTGGGSFRWLSVDSWPVRIESEAGVLTQFLDVTEEVTARSRLDAALERLQRHVLPPENPSIPGVTVTMRYRNVVEPLRIGGDFCDVYQASRNRFGFFIGDAAGHGLDTVATAVIANHTLRSAGLHLTRPGRVLQWLHHTLRATEDSAYCSAIHGNIRLQPDGVVVELANAGHPRPIHIHHGAVDVIETAGQVAGALDDFVEPPTVSLALAPGDELVFYTDGLIESVTPRCPPEAFARRLRNAADTGT
jgi:PAS domain S-box-containing protein